jgi:hypothetical protein
LSLVSERTSFRRAWVHKNTRNYFLKTNEIKAAIFRASLGHEKFTPALSRPLRINTADLKPWKHVESINLATDIFGIVPEFYKWLLANKTTLSILKDEIEMYRHHYRTTGRKQDGLMRNMYFSLFNQLIRQDPALYVAHVNIRRDHETRLIAYPLCARYYTGPAKSATSSAVQVGFYEGDHGSFFENEAIRDEVVLLGPACQVNVLGSGVDEIRAWVQSNNFEDVGSVDISPGTKEGESLKHINAGLGFAWIKTYGVSGGDVLFTNPGVPIIHDFDLSKERLSFSSGFVAINEDGLLENGVKYEEIAACHRTMTIPGNPRFGGVPDDTGFKVPVALTRIRPLLDALVRRLSWDDPAV